MEVIERHIYSNDWITIICISAFALLVIASKIDAYYFKNFMMLLFTDKYVKTHNEASSSKSIQTVLGVFQIIIIPLIIHVLLFNLKYIDGLNIFCYLKFLGAYVVFYGGKYLLEKALTISLGLSVKLSAYMFEKQAYKNYLSVIFFPFLLLLVYNNEYASILTNVVVILGGLLLLLVVVLIISHYRKLFYEAPFYFILYLCTFEIIPYILACMWIKVGC